MRDKSWPIKRTYRLSVVRSSERVCLSLNWESNDSADIVPSRVTNAW